MPRKTSNYSKLNAVRNSDGLFINTSCFNEEARHFRKYGYYVADPFGSIGWVEYWKEQLRRCIEGYASGGVKITGKHYGYLNFAPIIKLDDNGEIIKTKIKDFPDFWDGDYNYWWVKHIAKFGIEPPELEALKLSVNISPEHLGGQKHITVGKARRKGYSFKNAWSCADNYNTIPNSLSIIGAFDKKYLYPRGSMAMASEYLNFLNEHTGFAKSREFVDKQDHRRASYTKYLEDGGKIESGYMSEIMAITFKDNPDAARGKDAIEVHLEEGGAFPNIIEVLSATGPGLTAGKYITGQMTLFGTGGDMASGTAGFAHVFYNPDEFNMIAFENIWDEDAEESKCGFFHPMQWNREGYYDVQGNSDTVTALADEKIYRDKLLEGSSGATAVQRRMQEFPTCPSEAFLNVSVNDFPIIELRNRLNKVIREKLHIVQGQPVTLYRDENGKAKAKPDLSGELEPIWTWKPKTTNLRGSPVIYEYPESDAPKGLYKVVFDPYAQEDGSSLAHIWVYKGSRKNSYLRDALVAEYYGRLSDIDDVNRIFELFIDLYGAHGYAMHENMFRDVKAYFQRRHKLHYLAEQPDAIISATIKKSGVHRGYGCHLDEKLKDAGLKYIKAWLLTERGVDEKGRILTNIDFIFSPGLLEELIDYDRKKGNFDRVSSLIMLMLMLQDEEINKEFTEKKTNDKVNKLLELINTQYRKSVSTSLYS